MNVLYPNTVLAVFIFVRESTASMDSHLGNKKQLSFRDSWTETSIFFIVGGVAEAQIGANCKDRIPGLTCVSGI